MKQPILLIAALALVATIAVDLAPNVLAQQAMSGMTRPNPRLLTGTVAADNVEKLTSTIHWCTSLDEAKAEAQRQHKMIVWIHMLGQLDGAT
jgi:hypothetical protein